MAESVSHPPLPPGFTLLQVTPELDTGGVEQTTIDVAAAVVAAGGRSIVATHGGRLEPRLHLEGSMVLHLPVHSKNPVVIAANALRLARLVREHDVDLIHVRSRAPAFSALGAARLTGRPLIATYHGIYNAQWAGKRWYNAVMTRGDQVITNSAYTRDHVLAEHRIDPSKVVAIARGIDLKDFDPAAVAPARLDILRRAWELDSADRRPRILMAGRLTRWKGQALLIEAAARLKAAGMGDFLVLIVGDDQGRVSYSAELQAQAEAAGLAGQVSLVGHCSDMPAAYLLADIAVAPSLDPEAFGRTAVEPQLMGRPIIAAAHGAALETVVDGQTGWLAAPGDAEAWASVLGAAIEAGPERRRAMGEAARERARRLYSVQAMTDATLSVYARQMDGRAHIAHERD